jgi:hypothetical protein
MEDTPTVWVDTPGLLQSMVARLQQASSIALDTEHSSLLCYTGVTCLMQVSTGEDTQLIGLASFLAWITAASACALSMHACIGELAGKVVTLWICMHMSSVPTVFNIHTVMVLCSSCLA